CGTGSRKPPVCEAARGYACARANSLLEYFMNEFSFNPQVGATAGFLSRNALIAVVGAVALLGSCILLISTRWGIGGYPDSLVYVGVARSILAGSGVRFFNDMGQFTPVTQYPPLYPSIMAALGNMGLDLLLGSPWL